MAQQQDSGRVALVTGGSRGIGYGIAESFVARGDRVCITGRNEDSLKEAVERLGADRAIGVAGKAHDADHRTAVVQTGSWRRGAGWTTWSTTRVPIRSSARSRTWTWGGPQGLRDQRRLRARLRPADLGGLAEGPRRLDRERRLRRRPVGVAVRGRLRHEQGGDGQSDPPAGARVRPGGPGQRRGPRRGEDAGSPPPCTRAGRSRPPPVTRWAGSACPRTSEARSPSSAPTRRAG